VADTWPVAFSTYQKDAPLFLVSPRVRGTVTVTARNGPPLRLQVGRDRVAAVAKDAVAGPNLSGAPIVVRGPSGRTLLRSTLVDAGTVDPFGLCL
jgi:hypothetical protein